MLESVGAEGSARATETPWYLSWPGCCGLDRDRGRLSAAAAYASAVTVTVCPGGGTGRVRGGRPQGGWQLMARTYRQLLVDVAQVAFHGVKRHEQRLGDLGVAHPASSQLGYPALAGGQRSKPGQGGTPCSAASSMTMRTSLSAATSWPRRTLTAARTQAATVSPATEPCDRAQANS